MLPAGQDDLLRRILDPPEGLPDGWSFDRASVDRDVVEARYRRGDTRAVVRLINAREASAADLIIGSFALADFDTLPAELVRSLEVSLLAREHRVAWKEFEPAELDPEWVALSAGVKDALRIGAAPEDLQAKREAYEALGAAVAMAESGGVLYVARSSLDAERVRDLERPLLAGAGSVAERRAISEELGWALGHPSCCVEAFVDRTLPSSAALVGAYLSGNVGSDAYRAARDAWVPRPAARLNPHLSRRQKSLISFDPCRYDCPAALALADSVADACALASSDWLARADSELERPVVIAPNGARAWVRLERRVEPMRVIDAGPLSVADEEPAPADVTLASGLLGAEAPEAGLFTRGGLKWCLLLDFGSRGERHASAGQTMRWR